MAKWTRGATWTDTNYILADTERPGVSTHLEHVSLHHAGYMRDGAGFSLRFTRHHLGVVRELLAALEALPLLPGEEPEVEDAPTLRCPGCTSLLLYVAGTWRHTQQPSAVCPYPTAWTGDTAAETDCPTCHGKTTFPGFPCSCCADQFAYNADRG